MKRKLLVILGALLVIALCAVVSTRSASAADIWCTGYCGGEGDGTNLTWTFDSDYVLTISGEGAMADYDAYSSELRPSWCTYNATYNMTKVIIEDGVTNIGNGAFSNLTSLTSITIPDSVTRIGDHAFRNCYNLSSADIPDSVVSLGNGVFASCALTKVTVPENVTSMGYSVFYNCFYLTEINYNARNVASCGEDVFEYAGRDTDVTVMNIGDAVETISPNILNALMASSFSVGSANANYKAVDGMLYNKSGKQFLRCPAKYEGDVVLPDTVRSINAYAFEFCSKVTSVTMPDSVTSIGDRAFFECTGLTSVAMSENVTSFGESAFGFCTKLTSFTIPENITYMGKEAFRRNDMLSEINYNAINAPDLSVADYMFGSVGCETDGIVLTIGAKVEHIPNQLFYYGYKPTFKKVIFLGDKPTIGNMAIYSNTFTAYYPYGNSTWNEKPVFGDNNITWIAYSLGDALSITVETLPDKLTYIKGEELDLTGLTFLVEFSDGCVEAHTADELDSATCDFSKIGSRPVTITYRGATGTFNITVGEATTFTADSSTYPESLHNYLSDMDETYNYSYEGASRLTVTFSSASHTEAGADFMYVYDSSGSLIGQYSGSEIAGLTLEIQGDGFSIRFTSDDSYEEYGFSIDSIVVTTIIDHCIGEHVWEDELEYVWAADNSTVTANRYCALCSDVETETVEAAAVTTATCTEAGTTTYTAEFTNPLFQKQTKTVDTPALGHDPGEPVHENETAPTQTEPGSYEAVVYCTRCHTELSRELQAVPPLSNYITITNCKLELAGKISIRLYFKAPENAKTAKIFYEDVKTHGYPETASVTLALTRTGNPNYSASQDLFIMTFPKITSREMTRNIKFVVYDQNDQPMWIYYQQGDTYFEEGFEYCAADWANRILNKADSTDEAKFMAKALLNYGGCAQVYLNNFNPDKPANPLGYLAEEMAALEPNYNYDFYAGSYAETLGFERFTLALEADTTLRLYFNKPVKVYVEGVEKKVYQSGGTYLVLIEGISSRNISTHYWITVCNEDETECTDFTCSVLCWANKQIYDENERSIPTAKALYLYNQAAKAYLK